ncbi:uncharacterized protein LACBIDRAFT_329063 [Laccaria bicolor S238N-H82]|uniref:Predicted protein n=1 Tax=Laccaria bicolor (strain S238N-H82 / ATCC MYA-4686) TaxID=486041 RepID=B0DGY0_LACBS|nr:uncharacterized protein LACBIDRAFT_329063 [Laccaria bicolor S238N-H82]EDR06228.1 predicted protein [Laccaria bicolor S238N-H82]|eukprot:XP_001883089.1 predicted protein [Laccaria bicolor S238N-H82]
MLHLRIKFHPQLLEAMSHPPTQPANPPTAANDTAAVKLMANVSHELCINTAIPANIVKAVTFYSTDASPQSNSPKWAKSLQRLLLLPPRPLQDPQPHWQVQP